MKTMVFVYTVLYVLIVFCVLGVILSCDKPARFEVTRIGIVSDSERTVNIFNSPKEKLENLPSFKLIDDERWVTLRIVEIGTLE